MYSIYKRKIFTLKYAMLQFLELSDIKKYKIVSKSRKKKYAQQLIISYNDM